VGFLFHIQGTMMKNLTYTVVSGDAVPDFERNVSKKLSEGWELYGQPFVFQSLCCQSLTKDLTKDMPTRMPFRSGQ
jgi:hypothetical protein